MHSPQPHQSLVLIVPHRTITGDTKDEQHFQDLLQSVKALVACYDKPLILFSSVFSLAAELDTWLMGSILHNMRKDLLEQQKAYLDRLMDEFSGLSKGVSSQVVWHKHEDQAILSSFEAEEIALLVKPSAHHFFSASLFRQPEEWRLCRLPKIPVLLMQSPLALGGQKQPMLLAVDVTEQEGGFSQAHSLRAIEASKGLSEMFGFQLHLMNAYPSAADLMAYAPAEWTLPDIQATLAKQHKARLNTLAEKAGIQSEFIHLVEGHMAPAVHQLAEDILAQLVVVTSHCRTGMQGFFIGNSAESLLETSDHNILVLKPDSNPD